MAMFQKGWKTTYMEADADKELYKKKYIPNVRNTPIIIINGDIFVKNEDVQQKKKQEKCRT